MGDPSDSGGEEEAGGSSPCLLHELGPDGVPRVDQAQARDVARWRRAERERLIAARLALPAEYRKVQTEAIAAELDRCIPPGTGALVSVYWPIRAEPDLRLWMRSASERGIRIALPVATALARPLTFREWRPGAPLARGLWNIPFPAEGVEVTPTIVIAPVVGFDRACFRLGYGGGFFDRTLAAATVRPLAIGVGYPDAAIPTIFPQPHDIAMDRILAGTAPPAHRVCGAPRPGPAPLGHE